MVESERLVMKGQFLELEARNSFAIFSEGKSFVGAIYRLKFSASFGRPKAPARALRNLVSLGSYKSFRSGVGRRWVLALISGPKIPQIKGVNKSIKIHIKKRTVRTREVKFGLWEKAKERKQAENRTKAHRINAEGTMCIAELCPRLNFRTAENKKGSEIRQAAERWAKTMPKTPRDLTRKHAKTRKTRLSLSPTQRNVVRSFVIPVTWHKTAKRQVIMRIKAKTTSKRVSHWIKPFVHEETNGLFPTIKKDPKTVAKEPERRARSWSFFDAKRNSPLA